jgi:hypothetical protein
VFVLWPASCRRAGVGIAEAFRLAVWPALWPIAPMAAAMLPLRQVMPANFLSIAVICAVGGLIYAVTFFAFAVSREERDLYTIKIRELLRRRGGIAAAA